jgi:hypothetical protein
MATIDLKAEQQATLSRAKYPYSLTAKFFFFAIDLLAGRKISLGKAKLLEVLASIPYCEWEIRQYTKLTRFFRNISKVNSAKKVINWGRHAQDNEYSHLQIIHEKMKEDGLKDPWYFCPPIIFIIVNIYLLMSKLLAWVDNKGAYKFNAQFEDHAEHFYAQMVKIHPEWEDSQVKNDQIKKYTDESTWANIFRRICLDERDHRNESFIFCNKAEFLVKYEGMPSSFH